jgi:hypothetical protein
VGVALHFADARVNVEGAERALHASDLSGSLAASTRSRGGGGRGPALSVRVARAHVLVGPEEGDHGLVPPAPSSNSKKRVAGTPSGDPASPLL